MSARLALPVLMLLAAAPLACKSEIDNKPAAQVREPAAAPSTVAAAATGQATAGKELALDVAQSKLEFVGAKVTGDHRGHFDQYSGKLLLNADGSVSKLDVEVQLASLQVEPERLRNHLKSPDFFKVEEFPVAKFSLATFTPNPSADATHKVTGQLELHGVKKEIEFPAKVEFGASDVTATALFTINRKDFGIVYPGKPDDLIKDDVLLDLKLRFPKS